MKNYETVSEAVNDLIARGYTSDFHLHPEGEKLICHTDLASLAPEDFEIDEIHRFEGQTDPGDEMIVFAISSPTHNIKGIVVNAFGIYADESSSKMVAHLSKHL